MGSFSDRFTRKGKPWKQAPGEARKPSSAGNLPWAGPSCIIPSVPRGHLSEKKHRMNQMQEPAWVGPMVASGRAWWEPKTVALTGRHRPARARLETWRFLQSSEECQCPEGQSHVFLDLQGVD